MYDNILAREIFASMGETTEVVAAYRSGWKNKNQLLVISAQAELVRRGKIREIAEVLAENLNKLSVEYDRSYLRALGTSLCQLKRYSQGLAKVGNNICDACDGADMQSVVCEAHVLVADMNDKTETEAKVEVNEVGKEAENEAKVEVEDVNKVEAETVVEVGNIDEGEAEAEIETGNVNEGEIEAEVDAGNVNEGRLEVEVDVENVNEGGMETEDVDEELIMAMLASKRHSEMEDNELSPPITHEVVSS